MLIQSVQRASMLLKAFNTGAPELGVTELSQKVNLHKSTVSRLLATLEHEGLVERVPQSDKYRLGFDFVRLAAHVTHFSDIRSLARSVMTKLVEESRETVHLAVLDGYEVINVEQMSGPHRVSDNWVGRRTPLHCVANGKALLAFQPTDEIKHVLAGHLPRFTDQTITDPDKLRDELTGVRERGYAIAIGEIEQGLNGVAAPVRNGTGATIAAVSISGPSYRVTPDRIPVLGALLVGAAGTISTRLGFTGR